MERMMLFRIISGDKLAGNICRSKMNQIFNHPLNMCSLRKLLDIHTRKIWNEEKHQTIERVMMSH